MNLFICMNPKCQCIENTDLVIKNIGTDDRYPNMHLTDMEGCGDEAITVDHVMEHYHKRSDEILMLCSECNTSVWHNQFPKKIATGELITIGSLSKYNAITPYDHPEGSIVKMENIKWGGMNIYRLSTPAELDVYKLNTRQRTRSKLAFGSMVGMLNSMGIGLPTFNKSREKEQPISEKKRKEMLAQYKRQWKQAKKAKNNTKDIEEPLENGIVTTLLKIQRFKEKMDSLK